MKKVCVLILLLGASLSFAQDSPNVVRWQSMAGVITAQGVDNPVSNNIHSGTFAWTARGGFASVNLATGATSFHVEGLVTNGSPFSGTPGPIPAVTGTLVCNVGTATEVALNTGNSATLDARGYAQFAGRIANIPATCSNPLFLLRIARLAGANGRWIATGTERSFE
jgi:hypothetical protein